MDELNRFFSRWRIDWIIPLATVPIMAAGLLSMESFRRGSDYYFSRQLVWIGISLGAFLLFSAVDWRFLKRSGVLASIFITTVFILTTVFAFGQTIRGVQSWLTLGEISFQPADLANLVLILVLAKYFSRRHIEIANIRHILISGIYALIFFILVFLQPDLGSAIAIFFIWLGMTIVSGISKKHLLLVFLAGILIFVLSWGFVLKPYQKDRILTFLNPMADIQGAGYNGYQSMIAVGSGGLFGKGVGFGTQSRLQFLPEYQTDFIFAAFAEEWGFVGVVILFFLYGIIVWRVVGIARHGASNFESLYALGFAVFLMSRFVIHVGMNIGLLPITGLPLPFMSYGGSHLLSEFMGLGILMGTRRYARSFHRDDIKNEFLGI